MAQPQPALVAPLRRWDPEQVGGYVVLGRLGAGAMGQVYLGRSAAGRLVAIKTIKSELAEEPDFRTRFGQEIAAARRVSGAFTAAVVAADSEADVPWLATVYVPAPSLTRLVRSCGPLPVPAVCWLAAGCAEALEAIHGVGLVHRDLKPSNVLVSPDGPRVIDFGVARAAERIQLTVTRGSIGTPAYMAPEQARDTRQATAASDVFSLGATMVFAATGHPPYLGETVMDVLVRLATEPPDLSGLPAELAGIVTACLERDPRNRPTTASIVARLAASADLDTPSLPPEAFALIEAYRTAPADGQGSRTAGAAGQDDDIAPGDESTLGSHAAAAGPARIAGSPDTPRTARAAAPRRRALLVLTSALAAVALAGGGLAVGEARAGGGHPRPATSSTDLAGRRSPVPSEAASLGPVIQLPGGPPPGSGLTIPPGSGEPYVALNQPTGDGHTIFIVHGQNWPPLARLTVTLVGVGASPIHPVADLAGNFNYAINQDHEFFRGAMPRGVYEVLVTGPHGGSGRARFQVQSL